MKTLLTAVAALALVPTTAFAQEEAAEEATTTAFEQRAADVVAALREEMAYDAVFNEAFRTEIPEMQFTDISLQLEGQFGPLIGLESVEAASETTGTIRIRFERAIAIADMSIEPEEPNLVSGLLLNNVEPVVASE